MSFLTEICTDMQNAYFCALQNANRSFASEEVTLELLKCKCLPVLLYGLEVCAMDKRALQSLDFSVTRFFL